MPIHFSAIIEGAVVAVPLSDPAFKSIRIFLDQHMRNALFRSTFERDCRVPEPGPLHYCRRHGRLENGLHRFWAAKGAGRPALDVEVWDCCVGEVGVRRAAKEITLDRTKWPAPPKREKKALGEAASQGEGKSTENESRRS